MNELHHFPYKNILVLGLARSGTMTAQTLLRNGLQVTVTDLEAKEDDEAVLQLKEAGAQVVLGHHPLNLLDQVDLIVKNPGIPYRVPFLQEALKRKLPIVTEIELTSYLLHKEQLIGITGTNGKTTTTTLLGEFFKADHKPVTVAGNIGVVAIEQAEKLKDDESLLLELSSFQLMGTKQFTPHIAALLNLQEAHLDYHQSYDEYIDAKLNIFRQQAESDYAIYNADDALLSEKMKDIHSIHLPFSVHKRLENGAWQDEDYLYFKDEQVVAKADIVLVGDHNIANILAAIAIAKLKGVSNEAIHEVLTQFQGVEHRLQFVMKKHGRYIYNDSKATNLIAAHIALRPFTSAIIWIAGGLEREDDISELIPDLHHVKAIVSFGEAKHKFMDLAEKVPIDKRAVAATMQDTVNKAYAYSEAGDVILLSPACASWDQYQSFEERGHMFIEAVHTLK